MFVCLLILEQDQLLCRTKERERATSMTHLVHPISVPLHDGLAWSQWQNLQRNTAHVWNLHVGNFEDHPCGLLVLKVRIKQGIGFTTAARTLSCCRCVVGWLCHERHASRWGDGGGVGYDGSHSRPGAPGFQKAARLNQLNQLKITQVFFSILSCVSLGLERYTPFKSMQHTAIPLQPKALPQPRPSRPNGALISWLADDDVTNLRQRALPRPWTNQFVQIKKEGLSLEAKLNITIDKFSVPILSLNLLSYWHEKLQVLQAPANNHWNSVFCNLNEPSHTVSFTSSATPSTKPCRCLTQDWQISLQDTSKQAVLP